jgi:hypothetical protein
MIFAGNFAFTAEDMDIYEICLEKGNALCEDFKKPKIAMSTQTIITTCSIKKKSGNLVLKAARQTK